MACIFTFKRLNCDQPPVCSCKAKQNFSNSYEQKQSLADVPQNTVTVLESFANFTEKHLC